MTGFIYKEEEMADPLGNFVPEFIEKEVERESIVKLARLVTDRIPQKLGMKKSQSMTRNTGAYQQCVQMRWQKLL